MARVGIVGAGVFGLTAAVELARGGHDVRVFDTRNQVLAGTTSASTNRLHLGFHYPRDRPTALQSIEGSKSFQDAFPKTVNKSFSNYYGVVREESKTASHSFQKFISDLALPASPIRIPRRMKSYGLDESRLTGFWVASEGSIDIGLVRRQLVDQCRRVGVELSLGNSVASVERVGKLWRFHDSTGHMDFDFAVKATYGADNLTTHLDGPRIRRIFEVTLNLEISFPGAPFGLTLIDGDFLTILPKGFTANAFLYAPGPSVLRRDEAESVSSRFFDVPPMEIQVARKKLVGRLSEWLPAFKDFRVIGSHIGLRTIPAESSATDGRESKVLQIEENFVEILSGKIDHVVTVSREISRLISTT